MAFVCEGRPHTGLTPERSAGLWRRDLRRRRTESGLRLAAVGGRKRSGSASGIGLAQPCAIVSRQAIRIGRCKERAREGIQFPRATAHVFARATDRRNHHDSSLPWSSQWLAIPGVGGAGGRQLTVSTVITSGAVGGVGRGSGVKWLHGATHRGDLPQQRSGPHDLSSEGL